MERTLLFIGLFLQSLLCLKGAPRPLLDRAAIYIELGEELIEDADMHKLSASLKRPRPSRGKENGGDDLYQAARCSYGKLFQTVRLFLLLQASPSPDATMRLIGDLEEDSAVIEMALRAHLCTSLTPPDARGTPWQAACHTRPLLLTAACTVPASCLASSPLGNCYAQ